MLGAPAQFVRPHPPPLPFCCLFLFSESQPPYHHLLHHHHQLFLVNHPPSLTTAAASSQPPATSPILLFLFPVSRSHPSPPAAPRAQHHRRLPFSQPCYPTAPPRPVWHPGPPLRATSSAAEPPLRALRSSAPPQPRHHSPPSSIIAGDNPHHRAPFSSPFLLLASTKLSAIATLSSRLLSRPNHHREPP
ncbi:uncharacterized protein DS421_16g542720 [Arachis hypogaea]|nr:uncharacterized protein DS421_16g542720 [Arachis hypogaea]QHN86061.1 uncharacterized protein DS421_16g542720 [Arachis hypogaea]